jgi:L,D-peptidoglycan transpeptidase YkuD (ErfK/YbiS/YcfS/YnhG family)
LTEAVLHPDGGLEFGGRMQRAAFGAAGVRIHKQEGDQATPAGLLPLRRVLYRADRVGLIRASVPREPLAESDGWCDDPYDPAYNTKIRLPHAARHEKLWRDDPLYDVIGVLGWNDQPVVRHAGSAIFLHVARRDLAPTEGCVALPLDELLALLAAGLSAIRVLPPG